MDAVIKAAIVVVWAVMVLLFLSAWVYMFVVGVRIVRYARRKRKDRGQDGGVL